MIYAEVTFNSKTFRKIPMEPDEPEPWFAGEDLAEVLVSALADSGQVSIHPDGALVEEDWGWCICLKVVSFFLGVGEDPDEERGWKVFIAKDFAFFARVFRNAALRNAIPQLKAAVDQVLRGRDDVTDIVWDADG